MSDIKHPWNDRGNLESPCYDRETKTDCPDRCGGCQIKCERWQAYVVERQKVYDKRLSDFHANAVICESSYDAHIRHIKKQQRLKRYYR